MKVSSCSLPDLHQVKTGGNATSAADKEIFKSGNFAAVCKVDKLPVIQSNTQGNVNVGLPGKYQTTKEMEGKNMAAALPKMQAPPVARMTTTFRESYRGLYGTPAPSMRRRQALPGPHRVGSSSYSIDFGPKPLRKHTPPKVRQGNILNSYPGNVLYPYTLPEQVITIWKPFPIEKSKSDQTDEILARLVSNMYCTSYQLDFTKSGTPIIPG